VPTLDHSSLLDRRGRHLGPAELARGNHCPSIIDAYYAFWNGSYVEETAFTATEVQDDKVDTLVFTQDVPVSLQLLSQWGASTAPYVANHSNWEERIWVTGTLTGNAIFVPDLAIVEYGKQAAGPTLTNAVNVKGYLLATMCQTRGLEDDGEALTPTLHLRAWCEGAVMSGWATHIASVNSLTDCVNWSPVILAEDDYTQAMRDAGNLFIFDWAGASYVCPIVGLYGSREVRPM
jgi:hypothetical protein